MVVAPLPRLTRSLRAYTQLEPVRNLTNSPLVKGNLKKHNGASNSRSWKDILEYMDNNQDASRDALPHMITLRISARALVGSEQSEEMADNAAVFLLNLFMNEKIVLMKHLSLLKQSFGSISTTAAKKICDTVQNISNIISDDFKKYVAGKDNKEEVKEFGHDMTYIPSIYKPDPNRLKLLYKIRVKPTLKKISKAIDFSMKYEQPIEGSAAPQSNSTRGNIRRPDNKFGKLWLESEVQKFNQNLNGLSTADVLQSIISMLHSPRSNDELQNELFDLLGFDKFEFIEQLLMHRDDVVENLKKPTQIAEAPERPPQYLCQVTVQLEEERIQARLLRKEEKRLAKYHNRVVQDETCDSDINLTDMRARRQYDLTAPETNYLKMPSTNKDPKNQKPQAPVYPNVYDSSLKAKLLAGHVSGHSIMLPGDVKRVNNNQFEEVSIPPMEPTESTVGQNLIPISDLDPIGQAVFQHTSTLNRIQSVVFQTAYNTNENLLVCAPTGAGKTNIALLTVVHQIKQHIDEGQVLKNDFKIVYIAPMKALAAEMTASFGKKLQCVGIAVRELTGDMQLTKTEILQTHMLVTTPEKWDVVTRKGTGGVALASIVKLLIIDEVHLLHGDRGPTVESVVARTLRQVESSQSMIRIVGLSATLPNYVDVARFLRVNPYIGLFYFDSSFRPVPLAQTFIGVKETTPIAQMNSMNEICYNKASELVQQGHQVMVFVHARNATHQTAMVLKGLSQTKAQNKIFEVPDSAAYMRAKKTISNSRNRQLADLFPFGFACHHAGMLRSDRNLVEKYFSEGFIKVLVCTSTLAWGVNLPAHGVIIRGTEIYDSKHGTFIDLGILDVLQIFGRAGRPQFDKSGTAIIITSHVKLSHYLSLFTNAFPIESNFINHLVDNLNAEIALGTITNVGEAIEWLSYTYLFIRMRINPQVYGLNYTDVHEEPSLESKRRELIKAAAMALDKACMIRYNDRTGDLNITDLGRTASHFYIKYDTIEMFNEKINDVMTEEAIFGVLSRCQEFTQLKVRKEEMTELWSLKNDNCTYQVQDCAEELLWKINILLQTYLSRAPLDSFSLQSDLGYISQNAVRIARALFDITLRKNNPIMAGRFLLVAKMLEHQQWEWETPMRQFNVLTYDIIRKIESHNLSVEHILDLDKAELGELLHHPRMGPVVKRCAEELPLVEMTASLHPITRTVLRIRLEVIPNFRWNDRFHGKSSEPFWIWIEDPETNFMYYHEYFLLTKKQVCTREPQELVITIPLSEPLPPQYYVRAISDRWLGSESYLALSFKHLILPEIHPPHTDLLELQPLPVTALNNTRFECLYNFTHFNPIQTQIFHCLYHTDNNVLLGAPTGSGKTIAAEIAMFRVFSQYPKCKVVYIAPLKALVRERMTDWKVRLENRLNKKVVELTGDVTPDIRAIKESHVIVTTPEKWDGISRSWQTRNYVKDVALIIIDEIHLLGEDRGPVLEVIVSRTNFIESHTSRTLRVVGLSTALANARDLANWLNIGQMGLYNFRPSVRPVPLEVHISGHPGRHYCPRMMTMNKPTFQAIRQHSPHAPSLVFVSSRRQTRLTALELIAYLAAGDNPKQWLHISEVEIEQILDGIKDSNLKLTLAFGVGIHHAGLQERDRSTVEELFVNQKIQVLICTATLAWGVNFPAHLVVIKGTEFYDGKQKRYVDMPITDVLQMMGRAGRPQFDNEGVAVVLVHDIKKNFYKKFLYEPFPVESSLLEVLPDHLNAEIVAGTVKSKQDLLDYLTWTYFFRRLLQNPSYYKLDSVEPCDVNHYLSNLVQTSLDVLIQANCVEVGDDLRSVYCTWMGRIASYYYMSYKTMRHFTEHLLPSLTLEQLIRVLADCEEYAQLPVRHNEDILNGELAQHCPVSVDPLTLDSAHTKAFLLLQAHFSRLALPCTDYLTDLKSVLDQAIRVLQAMIDCTAEHGWLSASLRCQQILQMVVQSRWVQDSPLLMLPNVESHHLYLFETLAKEQRKPLTQLNGLKTAWMSNYESVAGFLRKEFNENDIKQIYKVVCDLPTVNIKFSLRGTWESGEDMKTIRQPPSREEWITLHADQEYTLVLDVNRKGANPNNIYSPKFPKNKNESWFLSVGSLEHEELLALKRISLRGTSTQQLTFYTPVKQGRCIYTVYVMSDCYLGLDQQYDIQVNVVAPLNKDAPFPDCEDEKSLY